MPRIPETRASLILRLPSSDDAEAWREFVAIYEPFIYRFARRGGLQDADARELVQNVMISVARAVGRWKPDAARGQFRTWLFRIARNQLIDIFNRGQRESCGRTISGELSGLDRLAAKQGTAEFRLEHRRQLFRWAAERIRSTVKDQTWQAFWRTAVRNEPVERVAAELRLTAGAVYIARSRVLTKLQEEVRKWEDSDAMS